MDVGHREIGAGDPLAVLQAPLEVAEPAAGELVHVVVELGGGLTAVEYADEVEAHQRGPNGADGGKAPLGDAGAALDVAGDQLAGLLGKVERYRGRLGHHEAIVVDDRRLVERADPAVSLAVQFAARVVERVDAIRQAGLFERPLRPQVFRLAVPLGKDASKAIKRDHVVLRRLMHRPARAGAYTRRRPRARSRCRSAKPSGKVN